MCVCVSVYPYAVCISVEMYLYVLMKLFTTELERMMNSYSILNFIATNIKRTAYNLIKLERSSG